MPRAGGVEGTSKTSIKANEDELQTSRPQAEEERPRF